MTFSEIQLWFSNIQMRILKYNSGFQKLNWDFWNEIVIFRNWIEISKIQLWFLIFKWEFWNTIGVFWDTHGKGVVHGTIEIA